MVTKETRALERGPFSDLVRNTLDKIPTRFGRMVYLSSLRDVRSGAYEHYGLSLIYGQKEAERAIRRSHAKEFEAWLSMPLSEQKSDLVDFMKNTSADIVTVLDTWSNGAPFRHFLPPQSRLSERDLFQLEFRTLLQLLRAEFGVDEPDLGA